MSYYKHSKDTDKYKRKLLNSQKELRDIFKIEKHKLRIIYYVMNGMRRKRGRIIEMNMKE